MRKSTGIIFTLVLLLSMDITAYAAYAQSAQTVRDPIVISEINTYRIIPVTPDSAVLQQPVTLGLGNESYVNTPVEKMGLGIVNTTTSWADIPGKIAEVSERDNLLLGVTLGFGEGLVSGIIRGVSGVVDVATFGIAPYDRPIIEPQYKVENPDEGFKIDILKW